MVRERTLLGCRLDGTVATALYSRKLPVVPYFGER